MIRGRFAMKGGYRQRNGGGYQGSRPTYEECTKCGKKHSGGAANCWSGRDLEKELAEIQHLQKAKEDISKRRKSNLGKTVHEMNKDEIEAYTTSRNPLRILHTLNLIGSPWTEALEIPVKYPQTCLNVCKTEQACIDSGSQTDIDAGADSVGLTLGKTCKIEGVSGHRIDAYDTAVGFSTVTATNKPYVIHTGGKGLWTRSATENILSLGNLLKAKFQVRLEAGRAGDPQYGGYILTPDGETIILTFRDSLWRLPTCEPTQANLLKVRLTKQEIRRKLETTTSEHARKVLTCAFPADGDVHACHRARSIPLAELPPEEMISILHAAWGHPFYSKFEHIYKHYEGKNLPSNFLQLLRRFRCRV